MNWHILPNNDLKEHTESKNCECKPTVRIINKSMLIVHNSYDGREIVEKEIEKYINKKRKR